MLRDSNRLHFSVWSRSPARVDHFTPQPQTTETPTQNRNTALGRRPPNRQEKPKEKSQEKKTKDFFLQDMFDLSWKISEEALLFRVVESNRELFPHCCGRVAHSLLVSQFPFRFLFRLSDFRIRILVQGDPEPKLASMGDPKEHGRWTGTGFVCPEHHPLHHRIRSLEKLA